MKSRVALHPVFILHTRPFRDSSLLVDALAMEYGRISLLAHGVRKTGAKLRGIMQPFVPLLMSWSGNTDLVSMSKVEAVALPYPLTGKALMSGFYLNELIIRLLHRYDPYPNVYSAYQNTLMRLQKSQCTELVLRLFEKCLLEELGYGLHLDKDLSSNSGIVAERWYEFIPGRGLIQCSASSTEHVFSGRSVLAFLAETFDDANVLRDAKRLMRIALQTLLGDRVLKSRELFI